MLLALQVKVGKVASFVVRAPTTKTTNILSPRNYQLYGTLVGKVASFVVRAPTTKTTNILSPRNYQLYGTLVGKVASFVVRAPTTKTMNILSPRNYQLYGTLFRSLSCTELLVDLAYLQRRSYRHCYNIIANSSRSNFVHSNSSIDVIVIVAIHVGHRSSRD